MNKSGEMFWTLVLTKGRLVSTVAKQRLCHAFTFHVFWGVCKKSIQELLNILTGSTYTSSKLHSWCHWKQTQNTKSKQNYIVKVKRPLVLNACKLNVGLRKIAIEITLALPLSPCSLYFQGKRSFSVQIVAGCWLLMVSPGIKCSVG